jgi:hypothetical protein
VSTPFSLGRAHLDGEKSNHADGDSQNPPDRVSFLVWLLHINNNEPKRFSERQEAPVKWIF